MLFLSCCCFYFVGHLSQHSISVTLVKIINKCGAQSSQSAIDSLLAGAAKLYRVARGKGDEGPQRAGLKLEKANNMETCWEEDLANPASHDILVPKTQASCSKLSYPSVTSDRKYGPSGGGQNSIMFACHLLGNQCSISLIKERLH